MQASSKPTSAHIVTRLICALLASGALAAVLVEIVIHLRAGRWPDARELRDGAAALPVMVLFAGYAIKGPPNTDTGVLAEPSEQVRVLATRPGSKIEAIKAYRQQTGVDVKRATKVVERLASRS